MKTLITSSFAAIVFCCTTSFAQYKLWNEETKTRKEYNTLTDYVFDNATFIFEGEQIDSHVFKEKPYGVYTSHKMKISHIYRGSAQIKSGTVELVTKGGTYEPKDKNGNIIWEEFLGIEVSHPGIDEQLGRSGIYFCVPSKHPCFDTTIDNPGCVMAIENVNTHNFQGFSTKFNNREELNTVFKQYKDIVMPILKDKIEMKVPELKPNDAPDKKKGGPTGSNAEKNQIDYAQRLKNYNNYMQFMEAKLKNKNGSQNKSAANPCKEFFMSEYLDGPNKNKVIEIFNPSDSIKSLVGYSIRIFNNGAPTPTEVQLQGNVNPKETYVVAHPQADANILSKAHQTDVKMNFDGNDAVVLNQGTSNYVDKIGEIGVNPGVGGWTVPPSGSTKSKDLRRKYPIDKGETDWNQGKNQWNVFPPDSAQNIKQHNNVCNPSATNDLSFSFANAQETGTNPKFLEFDIMAKANNNTTYFDNCLLRIAYSTSAFGSSLVANNKVTITKGATYNSVTYIDPDSNAIDQASSVLGVPFGTDFNQTSWNRTLATTTPTQILHFKIQIQTCNQFSGIDFTDITFTPIFSFYAATANAGITNTLSYDNTNYSAGINQELCPFKITSFTSPIYPGTFYKGTPTTEWKLTINGNGFGSTRGNGNVYFKNANTGGQDHTPVDSTDFISWSNTKIEISMPSRLNAFPTKTPGSGIFYVKTNAGDSTFSTSLLDIPYSINNFLQYGKKWRANLANITNDTTGIIFKLSPSITNHPDTLVELTVRKAIKDWACNTLINIKVEGATTIDTSVLDGVSIIQLVDSFPGASSTLGNTVLRFTDCTDNNGDTIFYPKEIDLSFKKVPNSGPWYFDTVGALTAGHRDFYEAVLHEVGHVNLLRHVNYDDLMYYTTQFNAASSIPEGNRRWISANDYNGGSNVVDRSVAIILSQNCSAKNATYTSTSDQTCEGITIFIKNIHPKITTNVKIYPNPFSSYGFNLEYQLNQRADIEFRIIDLMGNTNLSTSKKYQPNGNYAEHFNIEQLPSGIYVFIINIDGVPNPFKIIKQ